MSEIPRWVDAQENLDKKMDIQDTQATQEQFNKVREKVNEARSQWDEEHYKSSKEAEALMAQLDNPEMWEFIEKLKKVESKYVGNKILDSMNPEKWGLDALDYSIQDIADQTISVFRMSEKELYANPDMQKYIPELESSLKDAITATFRKSIEAKAQAMKQIVDENPEVKKQLEEIYSWARKELSVNVDEIMAKYAKIVQEVDANIEAEINSRMKHSINRLKNIK